MTLEELSGGWNNLRNAVVGRGIEPPEGVPRELAARVGNAYERWRAWYTAQGLTASVISDLTQQNWLREYRELVNAARAANVDPGQLPVGTFEALETAAHDAAAKVKTAIREGAQGIADAAGARVSSIATTVALVGVLLSVPALAFAILGARK